MRTKKGRATAVSVTTDVPINASAPYSESASEPISEDGSKRVGVAWYVKPDGSIDLSRMRGSTREQLLAFVNDTEVKKALGLDKEPEAAKQVVEVFSSEWTGSLYDGLGMLMAVLASWRYKLPLALCKQALAYSEGEKGKLAAPTAAVINKWAPDFLIKWKEEVALAVLLGMMTIGKLAALRIVADTMARQSSAPRPNGAPKVEPAPVVDMQSGLSENLAPEVKTEG